MRYDTVYDIYFFFTPFGWFSSVYYAMRLGLIVDPDIKRVLRFIAKKNPMKLIIRCVIPLQVRSHVGGNLDPTYAQRMSFSISISATESIRVFNKNKSPQQIQESATETRAHKPRFQP